LGETGNVQRGPSTLNRADDALEQVRFAQKARDERVHRPLVKIHPGTDLHDPAGAHHGDPIGHDKRFFLVVRHVDSGARACPVQSANLELYLFAQLPIQRAQRSSINRMSGWITIARASATRCCCPPESFANGALAVAFQLGHLQDVCDALRDLVARELAHGEAVGHVLGDAHVREQTHSSGTPSPCCAAAAGGR
jgi:hypothetical protein